MQIAMKDKSGRSIRIIVPTGLVLNRMTARFIPGALGKQGVTLTRSQLIEVIKVLRECRRRNCGWKLFEAESADGERLEIIL